MNPITRMFKMLVSPGEVYEDVASGPKVLIPIIIVALLTVSFTAYYATQADFHAVMEKQLELNSSTRDLPDAQKEQIIEVQTKFAKPSMMVIPAVVIPVMFFIFGLYFFVVSKIAGGDLTYMQSVAIPVYANSVALISVLVGFLIMLMTDFTTTPIESLMPSNLSYYLNAEDVGAKLYVFARSLDVFKIWTMILMAIGFAKMAKTKILTGVLTVFIPWALFVALGLFFV